MLDKIFNKKKKWQDVFSIPERKNGPDVRKISNLGPKALQQIVQQQEKYITQLTGRIDEIRVEHRKIQDKCEQLQQKNQVINSQVSKMTNQHEQLTMKFDNLQNSLEIMIATNQQQFADQISFLQKQQGSSSLKINIPKNMDQVLILLQDRYQLCAKISQQNKFLKEEITDIQLKFEEIKERYEQAEKQRGCSSLIPELMQGLEQLKRQRKNENSLSEINLLQGGYPEQKRLLSDKIDKKQAQTMTSQEFIQIKNHPIAIQTNPQIQDARNQQCKRCPDLNTMVQSYKQQKQQLVEQLGECSRKYQALQSSWNSYKQEEEILRGQNSQHILRLSQQKVSIDKQSEKWRCDNEKLKVQIASIQLQLQNMREQSKLRHLQEQSKLRHLQEQNQNYQREIQSKSQQIALKQLLSANISQDATQKQQENGSQQTQINQQKQKSKMYEQKMNALAIQSEVNILQILNLKKSLSAKQTQINRFNQLLQKNQDQLRKSKEQLRHSQEITSTIQNKYEQLMQQNEEQMMQKISSLQKNITKTQNQLIYLRNEKVNLDSQLKRVQKEKKIHEQASKQLLVYKNDVQSRILPNLRSELQSTKKQNQRITQQKQMIQQNSLQNLNELNNDYEQITKQKQQWLNEKQLYQTRVSFLERQSNCRKTQIQTFQQMINKLNQQMTGKMIAISKKDEQLGNKNNQIQEVYEQLKSKQRKYQAELNQERIKTQTMKRTISVQEAKLQQNQKSSNKLYEDSMHKDKKITYMEVKLKQYKHMIQSLKKQKNELEKSFKQKIKTYEESITEVLSDQELTDRNVYHNEQNKSPKLDTRNLQQSSIDKDTQYFKNQVMSYQQSNLILKEENENLRFQIKELEGQLSERKRQVESLQQKRQQTLKQIEKFNLRSVNGSIQVSNNNFAQKQKQFLKQKEQFDSYKQKSQLRIKRIASKAYKGFDILLKKHQNLYKDFLAIFVKEITDREQVKNIESQINLLVNKSTDMKDVFQDYL